MKRERGREQGEEIRRKREGGKERGRGEGGGGEDLVKTNEYNSSNIRQRDGPGK